MGKPGFPTPLRTGCALTFPRAGGGETRFPTPLRTGCALTFPRAGGAGKPGFPTPLRTGCALPNLPTGWSLGKPGYLPVVQQDFVSAGDYKGLRPPHESPFRCGADSPRHIGTRFSEGRRPSRIPLQKQVSLQMSRCCHNDRFYV